MKIAYLGPEGSYTEDATIMRFPHEAHVAVPTINDVFIAVSRGDADYGVVPIENMIQGPVTETQDGLYDFHDSVRIHDMTVMAIEHALGACGTLEEVRTVYSKDQALKQCSSYLQRHLPDARLINVESTSAAVQQVRQKDDVSMAAIASERALSRYKLNVVAREIQNTRQNKTRFVVLGPANGKGVESTGVDATALVIYPPGDRVGILDEIITVISRDHHLSLSSVHSRPDQRGAFRFYMELEGHTSDEQVRSCIDTLRGKLTEDLAEVRIFGSYPQCPFVTPRIRTIGIVGGTGKMGRWFERFFTQAGYRVVVCGLDSSITIEQCVKESDAVIINVPISDAATVASQVGVLMRPGTLILDNTSIKNEVVSTLLASTDSRVEVLGMHTMFGPRDPTLRKKNVVFTRTERCAELAKEFESIFYKHGARLSYTDEVNHDLQMAFHQNLEHFSKIVLAAVLCEHLGNAEDVTSYSSPNSRASLRTMARVLDIDPNLLVEIQQHNPQGLEMIQSYVDTATRLSKALADGDYTVLRDSMANSLGALRAEMLQELKDDDA